MFTIKNARKVDWICKKDFNTKNRVKLNGVGILRSFRLSRSDEEPIATVWFNLYIENITRKVGLK